MHTEGQTAKPTSPILCVGEALVDLIAEPGGDWGAFERLIPRIGGAPANMSVAITRLGGRARFLGVMADDGPGRWIRHRLDTEGVDLEGITIMPGFQTRIAIVTGPADDREFSFYGHPVADLQLTARHVEQAEIEVAGAVIVSSLALTSEPSRSAMHRLMARSQEFNVPLVFDPNPRPALWPDPDATLVAMRPLIEAAAVLKLGASELSTLGVDVETIRRMQRSGSVLLITDGAQGSWYWYGEQRAVFVPPYRVHSVDSTGAGDAFTAALALRYVENDGHIRYADVQFANAAGALVATAAGAMDALPAREQVMGLTRESD